MDDMTRHDDLLRLVHQQLVNRDFAKRFAPMTESGERTIVVALREDTIFDLCTRVHDIGGAANVVVPMFDGLIVFNMKSSSLAGLSDLTDGPAAVDGDATVGVIIQRLMDDGGEATYRVCRTATEVGDSGRVDNPRMLALV